MNQLLFDRSSGNLSPSAFARVQTSQAIHSIQPAPGLLFNGERVNNDEIALRDRRDKKKKEENVFAHKPGVNALAVDRFEGKILLSGGADSSIKVWDLDALPTAASKYEFRPTGIVPRTTTQHLPGLTHLSFYPFDTHAFLSSSYSHHLNLYSTPTLSLSASFNLSSIIYTHALSPIATHLLVACATQSPLVRLVDLRSGANTHSLAGHTAAVLSLVWHPNVDHILASGSVDGGVRLWDVRMTGCLGMLDLEDSVGVRNGGLKTRINRNVKAHAGAVNALTWSDDGRFIVSSGHDNKIRVWDVTSGANTLATFGPRVKNSHLSTSPLVISPTSYTQPGKEILFFPNGNGNEILVFEMREGRLLRSLKVPGGLRGRNGGGMGNGYGRITGLVWREQVEGVVSSHSDGMIRAWVPGREGVEDDDDDDEYGEGKKGEKRKRNVLNEVFRDLTRRKITFG